MINLFSIQIYSIFKTGENVQNGDHSETQNLSTFSHSSKEVRIVYIYLYTWLEVNLWMSFFIAGYINRWITEKRQKEEAWIENTIIFKEKERKEEDWSLSSLKNSAQRDEKEKKS